MNVYAIPLPDDEAPGRLALQTALASLSSLFGERLQTRPAVLVSSSELALDGLMLALGALPVAGEVVAVASPAPEAAAKPRRTRKARAKLEPATIAGDPPKEQPARRGRKPKKPASSIEAIVPTDSPVAPPANGHTDARFSEPAIFTEDRQAEKRILARHGAIRGRKLG